MSRLKKCLSGRTSLDSIAYHFKTVQEWPNNCPLLREQVGKNCTSAKELVLRLLETISESLGLEKKYIVKAVGKQAQHVALNYYPPCPQPELTYGLPGERIQTLISNGVKNRHHSMLVIIGDKSHGQDLVSSQFSTA
ncbi:hypothetical protein ACFXTH_034226 [Malus domestica]